MNEIQYVRDAFGEHLEFPVNEKTKKILDSGERREFESGAVRDIQEGKGRCDLIPLCEASSIFTVRDGFLNEVGYFVENGDIDCLYSALEWLFMKDEIDPYNALLELAIHYEEGAKKYSERNWQKGIPLHCFIDSGVRHYLKYRAGWDDEPHFRAVIWNILGAIWTYHHKHELIDLPFIDNYGPLLGKKKDEE